MRSLSARERVLLAVGVVALVVFLFSVGVVLPMRNGAAKLAATEHSLSGRIQQATRMYLEASDLVQEIASLRRELRGVMFPDQDVIVGMMRKIDRVASELKVRVASIRPGETEPLGGALKYPVTVTVECEFPQLVRLLYELERSEQRLWVEGVEITSGRQEAGQLQANIYLAVYSYAEGRKEEEAGA